jgi:hypothetical protein
LFGCWSSCTQEIEIPTKGYKKQLVVNSIFSPHKPFTFYFSYTQDPLSSFKKIEDSIEVMLYENNIKVLDKKIKSDSLNSFIYPSNSSKYTIKAFVAGLDTVCSNDTLPQITSIDNATIRLFEVDQYGTHISQVKVTFTDPPGLRNYYELVFVGFQYDWGTKITDPVLLNEGDYSYNPTSYFFSDELFNGKTYTLTINRDLGYGGPLPKVILRSISRNYYLYRKYWTRHSYNQSRDDLGIGALIFTGVPQSMYNNITNGFGIFAGYVETEPYVLQKIN